MPEWGRIGPAEAASIAIGLGGEMGLLSAVYSGNRNWHQAFYCCWEWNGGKKE